MKIINSIFNETNGVAGTVHIPLHIANVKNLAIQYKLIADTSCTVELQFWGTVYDDADPDTNDDWVNITEFLTEQEQVIADNSTIHEISLIDSECTFAEIRITRIVVGANPVNTIRVGWNTDN